MALIVITVQDGDDGVAIGVQAEPTPPRVVSRVPPTPAQELALAMLGLAQQQAPATSTPRRSARRRSSTARTATSPTAS
jgi:hypothetical protein